MARRGKKKAKRPAKKKPVPTRNSPEFRRKIHDPKDSINNFHALNEGRFLPGEDQETKNYKRGRLVKTSYYEAPWSVILAIVIANSIAVFLVKIVIFSELGKPKFTTVSEDKRLKSALEAQKNEASKP